MNEDLKRLIERAREHKITPAEHQAQVRSFAYGNTHLENPSITREDIDRAMTSLQAERESEPDAVRS
jgi:hypothetical protein